MSYFVESIESCNTMLSILLIFRGDAPYTKDNLRRLAAAGSCHFETLYYQMASMYNLQTKANQDLPASFVVIYDIFVQLPEAIQDKHSLLGRHWNKGDSTEVCTLLVAESNYHDLLVCFYL